jgi:hypothetical protein
VFKDISGTSTMVDDGYTDSAGTIAYYLSPITAYTLQVIYTGCSPLTSTITPTNSLYNLFMSCSGLSNITAYLSNIDGIFYQRTPAEGVSSPGNITFIYVVNSTIYNMTRVRFELIDAIDRSILVYNDSFTNMTSCGPRYCYLTLNYMTYNGDNIKGQYYVAVNGTSDADLIKLEGDAYWRYIYINQTNSVNAIGRLMMNVNDFFDTWGTHTVDCLQYNNYTLCNAVPECKWVNETAWSPNATINSITGLPYSIDNSKCISKDDLNKIEFSRIVVIFFLMVICLFILGRTTGYELNHPGSFIVIMSMIIWTFSGYGLFTFAGLTMYHWFNQYIFALSTSCTALGYMISIIRRYSQ